MQCAKEEIERKSFGVVEQFLKIHEIFYIGNEPQIDRIDTDKNDNTAVVYFPVRDEKFHLALHLNTQPEIAVTSAHVESNNVVYFVAYSELFDYEGMRSMTRLKVTEGKNKGDKKKFSDAVYTDNWIAFEPNPEPDEFEDKLKKLLDFLEQDRPGVKNLIENANGYIQAQMIFHNGDAILGGPSMNKKTIQRMAALNLEIKFEMYAEGEKWK